MSSRFGKQTKMYYAIKAAQSVIDTLNPNDHVSMKSHTHDLHNTWQFISRSHALDA